MNRIFLFFLLLFSCTEPVDTPTVGDATLPTSDTIISAIDTPLLATDTVPVIASQAPLPDTSRTRRDAIPLFARQFLGTPYIYAASDPEKGFDCSGFIYYVYHHFGVDVPRSSIDYKTYGREISLQNAQIADLIIFTGAQDTDRIGHIGIITQPAGENTEFIHASSGKEMAVVFSSLAAPHYKKRFVKVVDVISNRP